MQDTGSEWFFCLDDQSESSTTPRARATYRGKHGSPRDAKKVSPKRLEELTLELFRVHDLNGNGLLEEQELVALNEKIAYLHHGDGTDLQEVAAKYRELFRSKLDPDGRPVPYAVFRAYAREVLDGLDPDPDAQELILEHFVEEAISACRALPLEKHMDATHAVLIDIEGDGVSFLQLPGIVNSYPIVSGRPVTGSGGI